MTSGELMRFLLWSAGINYAILLVWFSVFVFAHDWLYRLHTRWYALSREAFDALNYVGISIFKIGNMLLFIVPALALLLSRSA